MTRATDYDTTGTGTNEIDQGDFVLILSGTVNTNTSWVQQTPLPVTIGTTALVWVQFGAVTTTVTVPLGGTGLTSLTAGYIPYGNGTSAFGNSSNLFWDSANTRLGIGTNAPAVQIESVSASTNQIRIRMTGQADTRLVADTGGGTVGTYSNHALLVKTNSTTVATFDTAGNLGLGVTPSTANLKTLQGSAGFTVGSQADSINITSNAVYNSGWLYASTATASRYLQSTGVHYWQTAASGTAGTAISFTNAMTLNATGALGFNSSYGTSGQVLLSGGSAAAPSWSSTASSLFRGYSNQHRRRCCQ